MTRFPDAAPETPRPANAALTPAAPRIREANRTQVCLRPLGLEGRLPADHRARIVWAYVESLDLTPLYQQSQAVDGEAGRPATDPKLLLALWLYATREAVGSARALDRLCTTHLAYPGLSAGACPCTPTPWRISARPGTPFWTRCSPTAWPCCGPQGW